MLRHRDRERERERERETDRQTDRQRDRQTDRQTETERQTETDRQTDRQSAAGKNKRSTGKGAATAGVLLLLPTLQTNNKPDGRTPKREEF